MSQRFALIRGAALDRGDSGWFYRFHPRKHHRVRVDAPHQGVPRHRHPATLPVSHRLAQLPARPRIPSPTISEALMRSTPLPVSRLLLLAVVSLLLIPGETLAQSAKAPFDAPKGFDRAADVQFEGTPADARILPEKLAALRGGLTEGFDDVSALPAAGWALQNNTEPLGATGWFQGNPVVFPSQAGADTSYVAANFQNGSGTATISNWLLTPEVDLENGVAMTFFARSADSIFPDRLQVRLSTSGASTNVGSGATDVGDFTELLLDINPMYEEGVFLNEWTQYTVTVSGLSEPVTGRFAFRYFVEDGGTTGNNSDFIGIDEVSITAVTTGPPTAGGPDAFGYTWASSNDASGPMFDFVDISGTGTA